MQNKGKEKRSQPALESGNACKIFISTILDWNRCLV